MSKKTLSDLFCDTYIVSDGDSCYIQLPVVLTSSRYKDNIDLVLTQDASRARLVWHDGVPAYKVRHKFAKAIRDRGDSALGLYGALNLIFTEDAIRELFTFPNVWLLNHNARAKKQNARETNEVNRDKKQNPKGYQLHCECRHRTRNLSVVQSAKEERKLEG